MAEGAEIPQCSGLSGSPHRLEPCYSAPIGLLAREGQMSICLRRREFMAALGLAAWPFAGRAQQPARVPTIGVLMPLTETDPLQRQVGQAFEAALKEAGYVRGQNLAIEYRWVAAQFDRLPTLASELVNRQVAAIVTPGNSVAALAAKA